VTDVTEARPERPERPERPARTYRQVLLVLAGAVAAAVFLTFVPLHRNWFDTGVYYGAINHWVDDGGRLYDYVVPGTDYGFTYPPFAALCMLPMAVLDWPVIVVAGLALNAAASAAVLWWLAGPVIRRQGWPRWFAFAVAGCLFALLEPVRDTFTLGQVNLVLLALVLMDARLLATGRERFAGYGIGLAAAIKLTPALFICYLAITGRWRATGNAAATAAGATLLAGWAAPEASRAFWTEALWDTDRVGQLAYASNQSWQGVLARIAEPAHASTLLWALGVLAVLGAWTYRVRQCAQAGDAWTGFALTGLAACLISPVTWVHHLVWAIPSLAVLADAGLSRRGRGHRRRCRWLLVTAAAAYVILCSSLVWLWRFDAGGVDGFLGGNAYVWICLGLLLVLPAHDPRTAALRR
jgi:alpha-1,2-mannosyltransferase